MPKDNLNKIEKAIITVLAHHRGTLSIKEVATKAGVSWVTAKKYLKKLVGDGIIEKV